MASILSVEQLRGLSSGDNPNTITLPAGQTLDVTNGTFTSTPSSGQILQVVSVNIPDSASSTAIPFDNTTPTVSEGFQISTLNITPSSASSTILLMVSFQYDYYQSNSTMTAALFRNSTCVRATYSKQQEDTITLFHYDSPSTTSQVTYNLRGGGNASASVWVHSTSGGPRFGGNGGPLGSAFTAMEIAG